MRVVLADDAVLLRQSLARALTGSGFEVVAEAGDATALLDEVAEHRPDVAIVDIRMPPTHTLEGLTAATEIRSRYPTVGVLVLSQFVETEYALRLLTDNEHRVGYLLKDHVTDLTVLHDALERISAGETVVDPEIVRRLVSRPRDRDPLEVISPRERDVLALMAEGRSNAAIADSLFVSERTVESHVANIFMKLGLTEVRDGHRRVLAVLTYLRT